MSLNAQNETKLLRFPTIHNDKIAFTFAGDIYIVPTTGGIARQLTTHNGFEMFPKFSPDGTKIAFTAQYDGNTEIYAMPANGGIPERLTYTPTLNRDDIADRMGPNNITLAWKDNDNIVFRSRMTSFNDFKGKLYLTDLSGQLPQELPLPAGGFCSYSPDKKQIAYNKIFREFRTWKYYKGGMADDIYVYDFKTKQTVNITNHPSQDVFP
ncbi:MAG: protease, partial [Tannerella sp.]|nr:protease [Tannerella sp.]